MGGGAARPAPGVEQAKADYDSRCAELSAAKVEVERLEREAHEAGARLRQACVEADAALPQCRMVQVAWRSGREEDSGRMVILKRTPAGVLVTRRVGDHSGAEIRFRWVKGGDGGGVFNEAGKQDSYQPTRELRDVPPEFIAG